MHAPEDDGGRLFVTSYANARQLIAWVLGLGEHARILSPPELAAQLRDRVELLIERHTGEPRIAALAPASTATESADADRAEPDSGNGHHPDAAIPPERFAR